MWSCPKARYNCVPNNQGGFARSEKGDLHSVLHFVSETKTITEGAFHCCSCLVKAAVHGHCKPIMGLPCIFNILYRNITIITIYTWH